MPNEISSCCGADVVLNIRDGGSTKGDDFNHYACSKCEQPCTITKTNDKIKVYKIRPKGLNSVTEKNMEMILEYLKESGVGDKWEIEVLEMTEEEYNKLPESMGF